MNQVDQYIAGAANFKILIDGKVYASSENSGDANKAQWNQTNSPVNQDLKKQNDKGKVQMVAWADLFLNGYVISRTLAISEHGVCVCECVVQPSVKIRVPGIADVVVIKVAPKKDAITPRSKDAKSLFDNEVMFYRILKHPHIVTIFEIFETENFKVMVLERGDWDLLKVVNDSNMYTHHDVRRWARQILHALAYIHRKGVVHRDVKPENIVCFWDPKHKKVNVKLCDFGYADFWSNDKYLSKPCGTKYYAAPEIIRAGWYKGPEIDAWSAGVVIYALLHNTLPFGLQEIRDEFYWAEFATEYRFDPETGKRITDGKTGGLYAFSPLTDLCIVESKLLPKKYVGVIKDFLFRGLLNTDRENRISVSQALENPWVRQRKHRGN